MSQWRTTLSRIQLSVDAILDYALSFIIAYRIELKGDSLRRRAGEKKAA